MAVEISTTRTSGSSLGLPWRGWLAAVLIAALGWGGIVYVAGHFSSTAFIAATVLWLIVFGRLFNSPPKVI